MADGDLAIIGDWYRRFANEEAEGKSGLYADLTRRISDDEAVLTFIADLPPAKRQPNLLLASHRSLFGTPVDWPAFRVTLLAEREAIKARMLARSTQTNEPGRCAVLLPLLASLPQPLAIIEVGAAAGLCLLPDRYGYDYGDRRLMPEAQADVPMFPCRASANTPLPGALPDIVWRAGLDVNPLRLADDEQMEWLKTLVWPGQEQRLARLCKAIDIARAEPPRVFRGNLTVDLEALLAQAPASATTVVFHSAVLSYVPAQDERYAFADKVMAIADYWIANESPLVFPRYAPAEAPPAQGLFALMMNGIPMAWTDPHGASILWRDGR